MRSIFRTIIVFSMSTLLATGNFLVADDSVPSDDEVERLILLLGAGDYHVRERAQAELRAYGIEALSDIQAAESSEDPEISERAKQLLSEIETNWSGSHGDDSKVVECMQTYTIASEFQKILIVRHLANPDVFQKGEGVGALCRIIRFERSENVRWEAAKSIIARTPKSPYFWDSWYENAKKNLDEIKRRNNPYHVFVVDFIELRNAVTEFKAEHETPATEVSAKLRGQLENFVKQLERFRTNIKNPEETGETDTDVLLYYALADLQDLLGMEAELATTLESLDRVSEKYFDRAPAKSDRMVVGNRYSFRKPFTGLAAHFFAAGSLGDQHRLKWAARTHKMIFAKNSHYKWDAVYSLAHIAEELNDPDSAANYFQQIINAVPDEKTGTIFQHRDLLTIDFVRSRCFLERAKAAGAKNEWDEARELIDEAVKIDPEIDVLIFRYSIPDQSPEYKKKTDILVDTTIKRYESEANLSGDSEMPLNNLAWLLGNTGRQLDRAISLSKRSLEICPELPMFLDTLAHAYYADKQYKEAVETQERAAKYAPESLMYQSKLELFRTALEKNEN